MKRPGLAGWVGHGAGAGRGREAMGRTPPHPPGQAPTRARPFPQRLAGGRAPGGQAGRRGSAAGARGGGGGTWGQDQWMTTRAPNCLPTCLLSITVLYLLPNGRDRARESGEALVGRSCFLVATRGPSPAVCRALVGPPGVTPGNESMARYGGFRTLWSGLAGVGACVGIGIGASDRGERPWAGALLPLLRSRSRMELLGARRHVRA